MSPRYALAAVVVLGALVGTTVAAHAQKTCAFSVSPSGASIDVPTNPAYATVVDLWEASEAKALGTLAPKDYSLQGLGDRSLVIRPLRANAGPGNVIIPTKSGIKIAVAVHIVADPKDACSLVAVELVTEAEAFTRRVDAEVAKRTAAVEAELVTLRAELAERVRGGFYEELAARAVDRRDLVRTRYVDRNADDLIVRIGEVMYLGDAAIVAFEIQNRRKAGVVITGVELTAGPGDDQAAAVALAGGTSGGGLGLVASTSILRGALVVRSAARLRGKPLALVVTPTTGQGSAVTVAGVVLK